MEEDGADYGVITSADNHRDTQGDQNLSSEPCKFVWNRLWWLREPRRTGLWNKYQNLGDHPSTSQTLRCIQITWRSILRPAFLPTGYTSHSPSDSQGAQTHNVGAVCLWGPNWLMSVLGPSSLIKNMKIKHLLQRRKGVLRQLGEKNCLLRRIKQNRK